MSSHFGSVDPQQCMLGLEGDLAEVYWHNDRKRIFEWRPDSGDPLEREIGRSQADALEMVTHSIGMHAWALVIQEEPCRGLMLMKIDEGRFRRVGIFYRIWDTDACRFERRVIEII